ncbi:MAG TPA: hydroxymethylbilane synthase [Candidatus Binatia bacterium]|nr:hydroxymethylbilane synthase [Candidatus Binatia bacterium]
MKSIRIGTRGSELALAQTAWVKAKIEEQYPDARIETILIKTSGDRFSETSVRAIGGKGIFTKEIEDALLRDEIDLAVHSMKDLPTELPAGLTVAIVPKREDPRDVLVSARGLRLNQLSAGARLGTGSLRRTAQILRYRQDLSVMTIRGNVDTRLKKLDEGEFDALVMAAAGLKRIGRAHRITEYISNEICLSAAGQGALGLESREGDPLREQLSFMHDPASCAEVAAERSFLQRLGGGCHVPVGARAIAKGGQLTLFGVVASPNGGALYRGETSGAVVDARGLGWELAERLLLQGAQTILAAP